MENEAVNKVVVPASRSESPMGIQNMNVPASPGDSDTNDAMALAKKLKIPFVDPLQARIEPGAVSLLKEETALKFQAVPIRLVYDILLVAMANPTDAAAIKTLELSTWCKIRRAAAPRSSIPVALRAVYEQTEENMAKAPDISLVPSQAEIPAGFKTKALTIAVISNKGGVGKTHFSINTAYALARKGAKALLIDADFGNADISNKLRIRPQHHLLHFLEKDQRLGNLIIHTDFKFDLICGRSGEFALANLKYAQKIRFLKQFKAICKDYDFALFDLGAGISRTILDFALACDRTVILTTPENIASAYGCAKAGLFRFKEIEERLKGKLPEHAFQWAFKPMIVINQAGSVSEGVRFFKKMEEAVNLNINLNESRFYVAPEYLGAVLYDRANVRRAEARGRPLLVDAPYAKASQCIHHMSNRFSNPDASFDPMLQFRYPFRRFAAILSQKV